MRHFSAWLHSCLMPHPEFERRRAHNSLQFAVSTSSAPYLNKRLLMLRQALDQTEALAGSGQLTDVELSSTGLKISPLGNNVPMEADTLREALYGMLPQVKVTDLLMEL